MSNTPSVILHGHAHCRSWHHPRSAHPPPLLNMWPPSRRRLPRRSRSRRGRGSCCWRAWDWAELIWLLSRGWTHVYNAVTADARVSEQGIMGWKYKNVLLYCTFFYLVFRFQSLEYFSLTNGKLYRFIPLYILKACSYFIHTGYMTFLTPKSNGFFCLLTVFSDLWSDKNRNTESPKTFNMTTKSNMNFETYLRAGKNAN